MPVIPDTTALTNAISSALALASTSRDSSSDIGKIQTQANLVIGNLTFGNPSLQSVTAPSGGGTVTCTFGFGTPWPRLT